MGNVLRVLGQSGHNQGNEQFIIAFLDIIKHDLQTRIFKVDGHFFLIVDLKCPIVGAHLEIYVAFFIKNVGGMFKFLQKFTNFFGKIFNLKNYNKKKTSQE